MNTRLRELGVFRSLYAGVLGARTIAGYKLLARKQASLSTEEYDRRLREMHTRAADRIYGGVLYLQGLMIKIGQTMGSRPDLFPEEYVRVLSRLQDRVPPRPLKEMRSHIEKQLGHRIEDAFSEFDEEPIAAASLAQVYRARLKDGRDVAVKVIYPNMDRLVHTDLRLLRMIIWLESRFFHFPLQPVYRELSENIPREVDMVNEAANMRAIAADLAQRPDVVIPEVVDEFTTRRVLTMQYIDGVKITDLAGMRAAGIQPEKVFPLLTDVYFEQILRRGHFQADPHPGNLLALPGNRLAILDFGLSKRFTPGFREAFKATTRAMFDGDNKAMVEGMKAQGFRLRDDNDEAGFIATGDFFRAMSDPTTYRDRDVMEGVNEAWMQALKKNPAVEMPGEMALPMRVFGLLFGLGAAMGDTVELGPRVIQETLMRYASEPEVAPA
jgi:predicted unusual protein kinase regulating ubiquinone biosynthesis (AarF/ABC1/UbiB family)